MKARYLNFNLKQNNSLKPESAHSPEIQHGTRPASLHYHRGEEPNWSLWQWQETSFPDFKRSQSVHHSMEICLASAAENTFQIMELTSWNQWEKTYYCIKQRHRALMLSQIAPALTWMDCTWGVRVQLLFIVVGLTNCITDFSQGHTDLPPKRRLH